MNDHSGPSRLSNTTMRTKLLGSAGKELCGEEALLPTGTESCTAALPAVGPQ